jgi:hypothetical protein
MKSRGMLTCTGSATQQFLQHYRPARGGDEVPDPVGPKLSPFRFHRSVPFHCGFRSSLNNSLMISRPSGEGICS